MPTVCVTTSSFDVEGNQRIRQLIDRGWRIELNPWGQQLDESQVMDFVSKFDPVGVIAGVEPWTGPVMDGVPSLRVISRLGVGLDAVDLDAARERDIVVRSTPDAPAPAVAELVLALMLDMLRKVSLQDRRLRAGVWKKETGPLLAGKVVAIVGFGRIGRRVGELCAAFGARVLPYDPATAPGDLNAILAQADIVTLHLPSSPATRHLLDGATIARMKRGAYLLNASRGGLVDEGAVCDALDSGMLAGAAFDVYEREPYVGALRERENVVLTPHIGSAATEVRRLMELESAANLCDELGVGA